MGWENEQKEQIDAAVCCKIVSAGGISW